MLCILRPPIGAKRSGVERLFCFDPEVLKFSVISNFTSNIKMSTKAAYLEHYLDSLETLPTELQRNFTLMRDLDSRACEELKNVDRSTKELLRDADGANAERTAAIRRMFKKALDYGDDKVQLAMQTYEMVDKHIRRLDADLARFEADLKDKTLNPSEVDTVQKKKGRKSEEKKKKEEEAPKKKKLKQQQLLIQPEVLLTSGHPSDVLDMPVDPNEPTYCFCHQVSYGEMIGCDNPDCPIEWFHFACVGLTSKPKGKWYCSNCSLDRKKQK